MTMNTMAMHTCAECQKGQMVKIMRPEHVEDLGGVIVQLVDSVAVFRCSECGEEETEIPAFRSLIRTAAVLRALMPVRLTAKDIRFFRRAFDMTQKEFAEAMELRVETLSRWESGAQGAGQFMDKLVRHNVCALLHAQVPAVSYDPANITKMRAVLGDVPAIRLEFVKVHRDSTADRAWDEERIAA